MTFTNTMPQEISQRWKASFGSAHPVGFLCRAELQSRWLRIHSLPLSKRYPDNDNERTEIVRGHLEVAEALLGEQPSCTLFLRYFGPVDEVNAESISGFERSDLTHLPELSVIDDDEELHFFATPFPWNEERLKQLVLAVADELSGPCFLQTLSEARRMRRTTVAPTYSSRRVMKWMRRAHVGRSGCLPGPMACDEPTAFKHV